MHSSTGSEGPQLVRLAVPCAQTTVAIEMHSRTNGAKRHAFGVQKACSPRATEPQAKREARSTGSVVLWW